MTSGFWERHATISLRLVEQLVTIEYGRHDIIYLCAPMTYKELCELYTSIFGKMSFNGLGKIIALLKGMKFIKYEKTHGYIESLTDSLFFSYGKHTEELIISFKLNRIKEEWRRK